MKYSEFRRWLVAQGDRLVNFLHSSKIEHVENALNAMGKRLSVTVEAA